MNKILLLFLLYLTVFITVGCNEIVSSTTTQSTTSTTTSQTTTTQTTTTTTTGKGNTPLVILNKLNKTLENEKRACFEFFWNEQSSEEDALGYGLIPDRYPNNGLASIASVGFGLAAFPIGVESGYITFEEGYERTLNTLISIQNLVQVEGFYYHFYNILYYIIT